MEKITEISVFPSPMTPLEVALDVRTWAIHVQVYNYPQRHNEYKRRDCNEQPPNALVSLSAIYQAQFAIRLVVQRGSDLTTILLRLAVPDCLALGTLTGIAFLLGSKYIDALLYNM